MTVGNEVTLTERGKQPFGDPDLERYRPFSWESSPSVGRRCTRLTWRRHREMRYAGMAVSR